MNIKTYRLAAGLTIQELAQKLGVSITTIHGWESGRTAVSAKNVPALAKALKVKPIEVARWVVQHTAGEAAPV